jgi:RND family efflux transporter MFP subunit
MTPDKGAVPSRKRLLFRAGALLAAAIAAVLLYMGFAAGTTVEVATLARGRAVEAVYATGAVESSVTVRIAPQVAGRIVELLADEGQSVSAGAVLARLDDSDLRASVAELDVRAKYAEQQFERVESLLKQGWVTREKFDQTRTELEAARYALRRASEQMRFLSLRTPVDGLVIRRDSEVGDFVPSNQPVFYLAKAGAPLRVSAEVDEEDIPLVKAGDKALVRADAFPGRVFEGRVSEITPKGDPVARSYRVRVALPEDTALKIGMTAEANIVSKENPDALLAPLTAVAGGAVWAVRGGRLVRLPVATGVKGRDRVEIVSGLDEREVIVVSPREGLKEGARVKTAFVKAAAPAPGAAR